MNDSIIGEKKIKISHLAEKIKTDVKMAALLVRACLKQR